MKRGEEERGEEEMDEKGRRKGNGRRGGIEERRLRGEMRGGA